MSKPVTRGRIVWMVLRTAIVIGGLILFRNGPTTVGTAGSQLDSRQIVGADHTYDMPPEQTRQVAGAVGATKLGWHIRSSDPATGTITMEAPARLGLAKDVVVATVQPAGKNTAVAVVSTAQYRGEDFGSNRRHIEQLLDAMDEQLPPAK